MHHVILAIYDKAVDVYGRPFVSRTVNEGLRTIAIEVNRADPQNMLNTHPGDYAIYQVGEWDDETAQIKGTEGPPTKVAEAIHLQQQPKLV